MEPDDRVSPFNEPPRRKAAGYQNSEDRIQIINQILKFLLLYSVFSLQIG